MYFVAKVNQTKQDWQLIASVEGEGFFGPPVMVAKACLTSYYPLMFRPTSEDCVKVFIFQAKNCCCTSTIYNSCISLELLSLDLEIQ
jgi:hypothetical protein